MSFEIEGKLIKAYDTEQKTESFRAREFVIESLQGSFPQFIKFQLTQDRCDIIDAYSVGQQIKVYFDLRGRQWQDKYFTNLNAWRIEAVGSSPAPAQSQRQPSLTGSDQNGTAEEGSDAAENGPDDFDDLPF